jgi:hypothetical protein
MPHIEHDLILIACHWDTPAVEEIARIREVVPEYHRRYLIGPVEGQNGYSFVAILPTGSGSRGEFASDMDQLREKVLEIAMADPGTDIVRLRMGGDSSFTQVLFTTDDGVLLKDTDTIWANPTAFARLVRRFSEWKRGSVLLATKRIDPFDFHLLGKHGSLARLLLSEPFDFQRYAIDWEASSGPSIDVRITAEDVGGIYVLEDDSESAYLLGGWDDEKYMRSLISSEIRGASADAIRARLEELWEHAEPFHPGPSADAALENSSLAWLGWILSDIAERCDEYGLGELAQEVRGIRPSESTRAQLLEAVKVLIASAAEVGNDEISDDLRRMAGYLGADPELE